ncbi:MAG: tetratricopeptide repeat protein, partial [Methyloligellaceae bacterium]
MISARGTIRAKRGKHVKARAFYERALKIAPDEPSILNNIALTYALDGEPAKAESLLRRAAEKSNSPQRVVENLALVLGLQGRFDEARQVSQKSVPAEIADSNFDFLRRMVRVAQVPAHSKPKSKSAATEEKRISMSPDAT